ncbi:MAG: ATP-binding protein [Marinoscillum sp.]|uniref:AAA family ATPase n=1 Tax=Marinoscillum sp. TaxID=2024838 RepID=UPI0032F70DE3
MIRKIAIIGPESTGKSELCQHLARIYDTEWVPEYARFYLDRLEGEYQKEDLLHIAQGQMVWEDDKAEQANGYLFCDTNLIVMKVWSEHKYGEADPWILAELEKRHYDFYLLGNIDLIWRPDPQREHPKLRKHFFDVYEAYLRDHQLPYAIVSGIEDLRVKCAQDLIEDFFNK